MHSPIPLDHMYYKYLPPEFAEGKEVQFEKVRSSIFDGISLSKKLSNRTTMTKFSPIFCCLHIKFCCYCFGENVSSQIINFIKKPNVFIDFPQRNIF